MSWSWSGDTLNDAQNQTSYMKMKTKMINVLKCLQFFVTTTYFISMLNQSLFSCLACYIKYTNDGNNDRSMTTPNGAIDKRYLLISQLGKLILVLGFYFICAEA